MSARAERAMQRASVLEWMAWRRYLIATRASSSAEYSVVEEGAWRRLREDLARVGSPLSSDQPFVTEKATAPQTRAPSSTSMPDFG